MRRGPAKPAAPAGDERLQKILAHAGIGSRRACEDLILQGRVTVNGQVIRELGTRVNAARTTIAVDGEKIRQEALVYFAVNKPKGYVSTNNDPAGKPKVVDLLPEIPQRVYTVGRLDEQSTGLMILTNDGELANKLAHPKFGVEKLYRVVVAGDPGRDVFNKLTEGVWLAEGKVRAKRVRPVARRGDATILEMTLAEGKNREVRRMLAKLGHKVMSLTRTAVGPIGLKGLLVGGCRPLSSREVELLFKVAAGEFIPFPEQADRRPRLARPGQKSQGQAPSGEERRPPAGGPAGAGNRPYGANQSNGPGPRPSFPNRPEGGGYRPAGGPPRFSPGRGPGGPQGPGGRRPEGQNAGPGQGPRAPYGQRPGGPSHGPQGGPGRPQGGPGRPQFMPGGPQGGPGRPPFRPDGPQGGQGRPQFMPGGPQGGQGRPQFMPGGPQGGQGRPPFRPDGPQGGQGRPQFGPGGPQGGQGRPPFRPDGPQGPGGPPQLGPGPRPPYGRNAGGPGGPPPQGPGPRPPYGRGPGGPPQQGPGPRPAYGRGPGGPSGPPQQGPGPRPPYGRGAGGPQGPGDGPRPSLPMAGAGRPQADGPRRPSPPPVSGGPPRPRPRPAAGGPPRRRIIGLDLGSLPDQGGPSQGPSAGKLRRPGPRKAPRASLGVKRKPRPDDQGGDDS